MGQVQPNLKKGNMLTDWNNLGIETTGDGEVCGKFWWLNRGKIHCVVERAKSISWERKRCRLSYSIHYDRQEQTEGSCLEKRIKRHSQTWFLGREEKCNLC